MKENLLKLKLYLKEKSKEIRTTREKYKKAQRYLLINDANKHLGALYCVKSEFRHHHIAYCELRGRKRCEIENPGEYNLPNEKWIANIKDIYKYEEETLRTGA